MSAPFPARGFGLDVIDRPGSTAGRGVRSVRLSCGLTAGASKTTGALATTAVRRIRPRICSPTPLPGNSCSLARVTADKPGSGTCHPGERARKTWDCPPLRAERGTKVK